MTVVCTGSIAYDYLMTYPGHFKDHFLAEHLDTISLSFLVDTMVRQRGGTAPNIAYTMALLGERPCLVGTVGEDFGDYRSWLESTGVDTTFVKVIPDKFTASFFANTDLANNQICSFYTGAMAHAAEISLKELIDYQPEFVIVSANDPAAMDMYVMECKELGISCIYDPGQQLARSSAEDLRRGAENASSLFVNEYEYQLLQKHTGLTEADIVKGVEYLVVTLGENGSSIIAGDEKVIVESVQPEKIADPTGVGDAFRAGFLRAYRLGLRWETCGQMGSLAATCCLEQIGTQGHSFTLAEFVARYRQHFDDDGELDVLLNVSSQ